MATDNDTLTTTPEEGSTGGVFNPTISFAPLELLRYMGNKRMQYPLSESDQGRIRLMLKSYFGAETLLEEVHLQGFKGVEIKINIGHSFQEGYELRTDPRDKVEYGITMTKRDELIQQISGYYGLIAGFGKNIPEPMRWNFENGGEAHRFYITYKDYLKNDARMQEFAGFILYRLRAVSGNSVNPNDANIGILNYMLINRWFPLDGTEESLNKRNEALTSIGVPEDLIDYIDLFNPDSVNEVLDNPLLKRHQADQIAIFLTHLNSQPHTV